MYYVPEYFKAEEIFSPVIVEREGKDNPNIWRLMDPRILWTADQIRLHFCGNQKKNSPETMTVNDYKWRGSFSLRGYRDLWLDILYEGKEFSHTSQHNYGRALDFHFKRITAQEVRADIFNNPGADRYQHIAAIEDRVNWVHIDCRNWMTNTSGLLIFNRG